MPKAIFGIAQVFFLFWFAFSSCNGAALRCNLSPPYITKDPSPILITLDATELKEAVSCRYIRISLSLTALRSSVNIAVVSFTRRQEHAALLNAIFVLHNLGTLELQLILSQGRVKRAMDTLNNAIDQSRVGELKQNWPISLDQLYHLEQLSQESVSRRNEAVVDLLKILQQSGRQTVFRFISYYCPKLSEMWTRHKLLQMNCSANDIDGADWYRNNIPLKSSHRIFPGSILYGTTSHLNILRPRILDAGLYSCKVRRGCRSAMSDNALVRFRIRGTIDVVIILRVNMQTRLICFMFAYCVCICLFVVSIYAHSLLKNKRERRRPTRITAYSLKCWKYL